MYCEWVTHVTQPLSTPPSGPELMPISAGALPISSWIKRPKFSNKCETSRSSLETVLSVKPVWAVWNETEVIGFFYWLKYLVTSSFFTFFSVYVRPQWARPFPGIKKHFLKLHQANALVIFPSLNSNILMKVPNCKRTFPPIITERQFHKTRSWHRASPADTERFVDWKDPSAKVTVNLPHGQKDGKESPLCAFCEHIEKLTLITLLKQIDLLFYEALKGSGGCSNVVICAYSSLPLKKRHQS